MYTNPGSKANDNCSHLKLLIFLTFTLLVTHRVGSTNPGRIWSRFFYTYFSINARQERRSRMRQIPEYFLTTSAMSCGLRNVGRIVVCIAAVIPPKVKSVLCQIVAAYPVRRLLQHHSDRYGKNEIIHGHSLSPEHMPL